MEKVVVLNQQIC